MSCRLGPWLLGGLFVTGCSALPTQSIDCVSSGRCTPISLVLGQPDVHSNVNLHAGMNQPMDALVVGTRLLVADCRGNRILVWRTIPTVNNQPPDYVLGQPDLDTSLASYGGVSARSMNCPGSLAFGLDKALGKSHLIVGDRGNGRVLIWNGMPDTSYVPADVVVGQTEVNSSSSNNRPTSATLTDPSVAVSDDGKLIVSDQLNSRVLVWNDIPQQDGQAANLVLGQPDLNSGSMNNLALMPSPDAAAWLNMPAGNPSVDGSSILIPDTSNDRILVWSPLPTSNGQPATQVLGQTSLSAAVKNALPSAKTLNGPAGISRKNNQLLAADQFNHRVLLWNLPLATMPVSPPVAADLVLGQADLVSRNDNTVAVNAGTMSQPHSVFSDGTHLVVADMGNNRVLLWNLGGLKSSQPAGLVLGQPDFATNTVNNVASLNGKSLNAPFGITGTGSTLIVGDEQNARLLLWSQLPQSGADTPTAVWGQPDFTHGVHNTLGVSATNLCTPAGLATDGTRLFAADPCNHRVLIWNSLPQSPTQKADVVLGQPDFSTSGANAGGMISAHGLSGPLGVASDGQRLLVADAGNNRVLIWNSIPTQSGKDADLVLGQQSLNTSALQNRDNMSLSSPGAVSFDGHNIVVADTGADRVLIWHAVPTRNQAPADVVIGQTEFVSDQRLRPPNSQSLVTPSAVYLYGSRLYVADRGNNRVLYWNTLPTLNGQAADGLIGQPTYADDSPNNAGDLANPRLTAQGLSAPTGIFATVDMLFIADQGNNRILVVANPPLPN